MQGVYIGNNKMLIHTALGFRMLSFADDLSLTPDLVFNGIFEVPLTKFLLKYTQPGSTVIDVGANIGYFTLLLGNLVGTNGKVISYEANTKNFELLKENAAYHCLGNRVDLRHKAVFKEHSEMPFYSTNKWTGNGSLTKHNDEYFIKFKTDTVKEEKIIAEPLNVHINEDFIDLIKIDIEGGEFEAFVGMEELLKTKKIGKVVFELNKLRGENNWLEFYNLLKSYGKIYNMRFLNINLEGIPFETSLDSLFQQEFVESVLAVCN